MNSKSKIVFSMLALALLYSIGFAASAQSDIVDRAAFRRPTQEILELEGELRSAVESRKALGLNADPAYVEALRGSPEDAGTARFGLPLTAGELAEVEARYTFAAATREKVLPFVEKLPTFAGAYFDHQASGELVILLTAADQVVLNEIQALAPEGRPTRVEIVQYTQAQLRAAVPKTWEVWKATGAPEAYAISVDTPANAIRIDVAPENLETAEKFVDEVSTAVGVPVFIGIRERSEETICVTRNNCHSPMKAGIVIRKGSTTSSSLCTMAFHIQVGTDEQFVTAGHCGYSGSNNWYHQGYGLIGSEQNTQYYGGGRDIMTVQISDSQDSSMVYNRTTEISAAWLPYVGEGVCTARGVGSPAWVCGTIQDDFTSWTGTACSCTVYGADDSMAWGTGGDSGSPIVDSIFQNTAVGVHNTSVGQFAIVADALIEWGYWMREP